jgi:hypothetical protein
MDEDDIDNNAGVGVVFSSFCIDDTVLTLDSPLMLTSISIELLPSTKKSIGGIYEMIWLGKMTPNNSKLIVPDRPVHKTCI